MSKGFRLRRPCLFETERGSSRFPFPFRGVVRAGGQGMAETVSVEQPFFNVSARVFISSYITEIHRV
jgi:hypothetical protein